MVPAVDDPDKQYPTAPKELRSAYRTVRDQLKTSETAYTQKIADYERRIESLARSGQDTTALTTRLAAIEKERDDARAELRAAKQEASPEFIQQHDAPYNQAAEYARKEIEGLTVIVSPANDEAGTPAQTRPATWDDFAEIYGLPTGKAISKAKTMFGEAADFVLGQRTELTRLWNSRQRALAQERAQFKDRNAKDIADQASRTEKIKALFQETTQRLSDANTDYKVDPADSGAVEARDHALKVYDEPIKVTDETSGKAEVARRAHIRLKIGAYPVMKLQLERANEKITNLEAQLAEYKGAAPGGVRRPGGEPPPAEGETDDVNEWMREASKAVGT